MIPKEFLINYDELKVGDPLWSVVYGDVVVCELNPSKAYQITVCVKNGIGRSYNKSGFFYYDDPLPTLFKSCPYKEEERVVEVSNNGQVWIKRVLIGTFRQRFICWSCAKSIEEVNSFDEPVQWKFMREITEPNKVVLTKAEIAEKFGIDPNSEIVVE